MWIKSTNEWAERFRFNRSMGINSHSEWLWKGKIKYQKGLPFVKKYISQWHTAYWSNSWCEILTRLPPFEKKFKEIRDGYIPISLLLEAEKWLRYQCSNNNGSCYAGWNKYIWKTEWADEYCIKNKINPAAFALTSKGIDLSQVLNDTAEFV